MKYIEKGNSPLWFAYKALTISGTTATVLIVMVSGHLVAKPSIVD
jgi:hypothetical protein